MIIVRITGGLGNQLFQYYFGRYLSKLLNKEVRYDIRTSFNSSSFTYREFALRDIGLNFEIAEKADIEKFKFFMNGFPYRIERKAAQLLPFINPKYFVENRMHHTLDDRLFRDNCYYDGYWQSYKYIQLAGKTSSDEMKLKVPFGKPDSEILRKIIDTESVGIHIRRGDYVSNKYNRKIFVSCSSDYYLKSISLIKQKLTNAIFYVFSDDIKWVKEQFIFDNCTLIEGHKTLEDFYLMSRCRHNIIANSTFSWWAAWLNKNPQKIVISPENWYNGSLNNDIVDLVPETWIKL